MIVEIFCLSMMVAAISATILLPFHKWRVFEWFQIHHDKTICKFCLGFWLCFIGAFIAFGFNQNVFDIAIPFIGASICRKLIE